MADLPSGTVTFLFTDIEGSTKRFSSPASATPRAWASPAAFWRRRSRVAAGVDVGAEDAFLYALARARDAVAAAAGAQRALVEAELRTRMGIHTVESILTEDRAAARHGGQVLVPQATRALLPEARDGLAFRTLGENRLKDLSQPQSL
jgi:class 3 adenylate cyclase